MRGTLRTYRFELTFAGFAIGVRINCLEKGRIDQGDVEYGITCLQEIMPEAALLRHVSHEYGAPELSIPTQLV